MRKLFSIAAASLAIYSLLGVAIMTAPAALATCPNSTSSLDVGTGIGCATPPNSILTSLFGGGGIFRQITNLLVFLIGAISVLMIIIGGLRYVLSGGDPAGVRGAKDTILYSIIGVVVATLAYAIINWVILRVH